MSKNLEWKELGREDAWVSPYSWKIEKVNFELPDGKTDDFYLRKVKNTVVVLALTENNEVILAKQYRPGKKRVLFELPGGGIEEGQTPEEAVHEELLQETGYEGELTFIAESLRDGYSNWISHCFVATNCKIVSDQELEPNEFIEVTLMPLEEFKTLARSGQMTDIDAAMLGLDHLKLL